MVQHSPILRPHPLHSGPYQHIRCYSVSVFAATTVFFFKFVYYLAVAIHTDFVKILVTYPLLLYYIHFVNHHHFGCPFLAI